MAVARSLWSSDLSGKSVIAFLDNDAAKAALVRAYSPNPWNAILVESVVSADIKLGALVWYERVPTKSNPADAPSRGLEPPFVKGWPTPTRTQVPQTLLRTLAGGSRGEAGQP